MVLVFFAGVVLGGAISGPSFVKEGVHTRNLVMCLMAKIMLMLAFVPIYVLVSVIAKQRLRLYFFVTCFGNV